MPLAIAPEASVLLRRYVRMTILNARQLRDGQASAEARSEDGKVIRSE
jgi:hypothetical protein